MNRVILVGRITKDIELRYTASNLAVANFTIAVNRQYANSEGEREADFINCVVWRKQAENMQRFTHKGSLIGLEGRMQVSSYEDNGQRKYKTEVVCDSVQFLDTKQDNKEEKQAPTIDVDEDSLPF